MIKTKHIRSIIIEHLQSNNINDETNKTLLKQTVSILKGIWSITDDDIELVQTRYGNLTQLISFLNDTTPFSHHLCYISSEDLEEKDPANTILNIERAKTLNASDPIIFSNSAAIYYRLGLYKESVKECLKAIECDKSHLNAYIRLGLNCWALNKSELALFAYNKGLELSPGNPIILHNIEVLKNTNAKPPQPKVKSSDLSIYHLPMPELKEIDGVNFIKELDIPDFDPNTQKHIPLDPAFLESQELEERANSPEIQELINEVNIEEMFDILNNHPEDLQTYFEDEKMKKIITAISSASI